MRVRINTLLALLFWCSCATAGVAQDYAETIAPLIDPARLATLGSRGANTRVQKLVYWLEVARQDKAEPSKVLALALVKVGVTNKLAADITREAILRNLKIAGQLGCLDKAGLEEMRHGKSPTVRLGPYKGQELSVDHIIPRSVVPELDNVIANLELMPLKLNQSKNDSIGQRQRALADKLKAAGLLSAQGHRAVQMAR